MDVLLLVIPACSCHQPFLGRIVVIQWLAPNVLVTLLFSSRVLKMSIQKIFALEIRDHLLTFLQGSAKKQSAFRKEFPDEYAYLSKVWNIRNNHIIKNFPDNYVFMLYPCYKKDCPHPFCKNVKPDTQPAWFKGGPPLTYVPRRIPDPKRKWGSKCDTCVSPALVIT